jgi:hypothetical protein
LVRFSSAGLQGVEEDLDSFGLLLCEFVLLITNDGRPEARTEVVADATSSECGVFTAELGQERAFVEQNGIALELGHVREPQDRMTGRKRPGRLLPWCGRKDQDRTFVADLDESRM